MYCDIVTSCPPWALPLNHLSDPSFNPNPPTPNTCATQQTQRVTLPTVPLFRQLANDVGASPACLYIHIYFAYIHWLSFLPMYVPPAPSACALLSVIVITPHTHPHSKHITHTYTHLIISPVMDVLLYMNPSHRQRILAAVGERMNRAYTRFKEAHPGFRCAVRACMHRAGRWHGRDAHPARRANGRMPAEHIPTHPQPRFFQPH